LKGNDAVDALLNNPPNKKKDDKPAIEEPVKKKQKTEPKEPEPKKDDGIVFNIKTTPRETLVEKPVSKKRDKVEEKLNVSKTESKSEAKGDTKGEVKGEVKYQKDKMTLEERQQAFREMLLDREVSAFSTWDKELHKIVFDPRYLLLSAKERKLAYESYVKNRAEEERVEKRNRIKDNREAFKKLVEKANLGSKATFSEFAQKFGKDAKFKAIEKMREREHLFNEYKAEQKAEKGEKGGEEEEVKEVKEEEVKEEKSRERSTERSSERSRDKSHDKSRDKSRDESKDRSRDRKDSRDSKAEEKEAKKKKVKADFMDLLAEEKKRISPDSLWSKKKKYYQDDERYGAVGSSSLREEYFLEYCQTLVEKVDPEVEAAEKRANEKREREANAIKNRETDVARRQVDQSREWERERGAHAREEAQQHFIALLHDMVRDPDSTWRKTKKALREDSRWEVASLIEAEEKEKMFNEHILSLANKRKKAFTKLLDECEVVTLTSTWKEVRRKIKHDARYSKFSEHDKEREAEYQKYLKEKVSNAKSEFRQLLREIKCISHKSKDILKGATGDGHMREIRQFITNDKRGLMLDDVPEDRDRILNEYITEKERLGAPPPPTATRPSKR